MCLLGPSEGSGALSQPPSSQEVARTLATQIHLHLIIVLSLLSPGASGPLWLGPLSRPVGLPGLWAPGASTDLTTGKGGTATLPQTLLWAPGPLLLLSGLSLLKGGSNHSSSLGEIVIATIGSI